MFYGQNNSTTVAELDLPRVVSPTSTQAVSRCNTSTFAKKKDLKTQILYFQNGQNQMAVSVLFDVSVSAFFFLRYSLPDQPFFSLFLPLTIFFFRSKSRVVVGARGNTSTVLVNLQEDARFHLPRHVHRAWARLPEERKTSHRSPPWGHLKTWSSLRRHVNRFHHPPDSFSK